MEAINIATTSDRHRADAKLLVIDKNQARIQHLGKHSLIDQFRAGDVLVVNAAATLPASFPEIHQESGKEIELRLAQNLGGGEYDFCCWRGFVLGEGDWHLPTEARTQIPTMRQGDHFQFKGELAAQIVEISPNHPRFITVRFLSTAEELLHHLYHAGQLIQYSYHEEALDLWDGQTIFSGKPMALEAPSAAFPLTWEIVQALEARGVQIAYLLHAAGISSTGESALDAMLPLPEYYQIPEKTAQIVNQAKEEKQRIIALGTSVTRALESAARGDDFRVQHYRVQAGSATTVLRLHPAYERKIVTGLVTGLHENGTSHLQLLQSFAPWPLIDQAYQEAKQLGYLWHEYGDSCLILA